MLWRFTMERFAAGVCNCLVVLTTTYVVRVQPAGEAARNVIVVAFRGSPSALAHFCFASLYERGISKPLNSM
jgi:hypothetical protein